MNTIGDAIGSIFGGGGSSAAQPTQTQVSAPQMPDWLQQPWEDEVLPGAKSLYDAGPRSYYSGETVTPFSEQTKLGMAQLEGLANNPEFPDAVSSGLLADMERGGFTQNYDQFAPTMQGIMSGDRGIDLSRTEAIADGSMLGANPYIDEVVGQVTEDATNAANRGAWFAGREGSPSTQRAIAEGVAKATAPIRMADYQQERGYMDAATNRLAQLEGANIANEFSAAQGLLGADQDASNRALNQYAQAPGAFAFQGAPAGYLMQVGGLLEGKEAAETADEIARHDHEQNKGWDNLGRYIGAISAAPTLTGSSVSTYQPTPGFSGSGLLGGALGGAALGSMLGVPGIGGISGAGLGAIGGGLLGGFNF